MMRRTASWLLACVALAGIPNVSAQVSFDRPALLTSIGQSSDLAIVKVILNTQLKLGLEVKPLASASDLEGVKSLVVVVGASTKGMGAAGLDLEKELARGRALMRAAHDRGVKVLVMHTGGAVRRGKTSNETIEVAVPAADCVVVVAAGNKDGLFNTLADRRKTPVVQVERATAVGEAVRGLIK